MALITPWPSVRQALTRRLRSNLVLKDGLLGDWHEGVAPQKTRNPHGILQLHYDPIDYVWGGLEAILGVDVFVFSETKSEADRLSQLAFTTLQDAALDTTGQTTIFCRFMSGISLTDVDEADRTIYQVGGVYQIRVTQENPTLRSLSITADSDIS